MWASGGHRSMGINRIECPLAARCQAGRASPEAHLRLPLAQEEGPLFFVPAAEVP